MTMPKITGHETMISVRSPEPEHEVPALVPEPEIEYQTAEYDPGTHTIAEVDAYLTDHAETSEAQRVIDVERAGRARRGILDHADDYL
jgi:hypothetical protein